MYYNKFDNDSNEDAFIKRSVLNKYSKPYYPIFNNDTLDRTFILAYDPSTKLDNSVVAVAELKHDDEKGYWVEFVNMVNLVEILSNGEKVLIQKPDQVDRIKEMLIDYNQGALDYDNINMLIIDAGAGGGGEDIGQYLMREWVGHDKKRHLGLIDLEDEYMKVREDDYPANVQKLRMFNFKRDKVRAYERAQNAINQGLAIFPTSLNPRMELEFEETDAEGNIRIRYENVNEEERNALIQLDLAKEELVAMVKNKRPNGTVQFDLSPDAKSRNFHDDRADVVCMILDRLMELRATEALQVDKPQSDLAKVYSRGKIQSKASHNPFASGTNPFYDRNRRFL